MEGERMRGIIAVIVTAGVCVVAVGCGEAGMSEKKVVSLIRLEAGTRPDSSEPWAYGLRIKPPWENAGTLSANFPEHFEYGDVGYTITRYHDKRPNAWVVEREGKYAHYEVDSLAAKGVRVLATAEVVEPDRVKMTLTVKNGSDKLTLPDIKPLLCYQYAKLMEFPGPKREKGEHNFKWAHVVIDGKIVALADIPTENTKTNRKGATVKPRKPYRTHFVSKAGGWIEEPLDVGVSVITSEDDKRAVILRSEPSRSMLCNCWIPCLHADPYFGTLKPGEESTGTVTVIFAGEDWRDVVKGISEAAKAAK